MSIYKHESAYVNALITLGEEQAKACPSESVIVACELVIKNCPPRHAGFTALSQPKEAED